MAAPTSTTNITGFFIIRRGCSLTNESRIARFTMGGSNSGRPRAAFLEISSGSVAKEDADGGSTTGIILAPDSRHQEGKQFSVHHQEVFHNRPQRKRRKK